MSICLFAKALKSDADYKVLLELMKTHTRNGFSEVEPCKCNPPCQVSRREIAALHARLVADVKKSVTARKVYI